MNPRVCIIFFCFYGLADVHRHWTQEPFREDDDLIAALKATQYGLYYAMEDVESLLGIDVCV